MRTWYPLGWYVAILFPIFSASAPLQAQHRFVLLPSGDAKEQYWVDSVFNSLNEDQRIGQLFMIRAHSDKGPDHVALVESLIRDYQVGSLCFFQGTPEKQVELINQYQHLSKLPLMVAIDGEWGLGMRMKESTISFPRQLMLGAIQNNDLIYRMGREIGRQMRRAGVQVNFAPVADINNNAANPVIHTRSFGEDRYNVAIKSYMYMKGMQDVDVMACAKHFPGHGDTDVDSHYDLPVINHDRYRLDSIELYPFRALSDYGIGSMMVAHLQVPALDDRENRPTTLSRNTVTNLLRRELGFKGLIFTDALEMKGVTKHHASGVVEAEALLAGNDVLCLPEDLAAALREIKAYMSDSRLDREQVMESVRRVLRAKYRLGLNQWTDVPVPNVRKELNSPEAEVLRRELIRNALTLVRNKDQLIPFRRIDTLNMASLSIGASSETPFQKRLASYGKMVHLQTGKDISPERQAELLNQLGRQEAVIVGLHSMTASAAQNFGLSASSLAFLHALNQRTRVVVVAFGSPYALKNLDDFEWVLQAYEEDPVVQDLSAQALFGAFALTGRLPVTASPKSRYNTGVETPSLNRMGYTIPEEVGLNSDTLARIARIANQAIEGGATPGCVVLVARKGQIVYHEAFGDHTYLIKHPVQPDDVYDLASVTKIAATTLSLMRLHDEGKLDIYKPLSEYLPELQNTNKQKAVIADIMAHRARFKEWLPFFEKTMAPVEPKKLAPSPDFYHAVAEDAFTVPVTEKLFLRQDFMDSIWNMVYNSELLEGSGYKYSDLGFFLFSRLVKSLSGKPLDQYVQDQFYRPLGLQTTTFNPWQSIPLDRIPPTEEDNYFRKQRIQGYVHDMGAAMLGGVSGHAGLFSNAGDLAVLMQMLLQNGAYGGDRFFDPNTVKKFLTRHPQSNRRALGFDMLPIGSKYPPNVSSRVSERTFGHIGFTGVCAWADPEEELVFIFLANRTFPSMRNYRLNKLAIRNRMQNAVYDALFNRPEPFYLTRLEQPVFTID